jgi:hypothetical protein
MYIKAIPIFLHTVTKQGIKMKNIPHKWKQNRVFNYPTSPFMLIYVNDLHGNIGENENHMS